MTDPATTTEVPVDKLNKVQIGRIVHFSATPTADCQPALVVYVIDKAGLNGSCNLAVFSAGGLLTTQTSVMRDHVGDGFGWHWSNECPRKDA